MIIWFQSTGAFCSESAMDVRLPLVAPSDGASDISVRTGFGEPTGCRLAYPEIFPYCKGELRRARSRPPAAAQEGVSPVDPHHASPERADAARNRSKILRAAARIAATEGPSGLALDVVARRAGVGVGTVYRRFGDRAGLVFAMLEEHAASFQEALTNGPPPLGPGAPPQERLRALLHVLVDVVEEHQDLLLVAEASSPGARYESRPYAVQRDQLEALLTEMGPQTDARYLAEALLAPLTPSLIAYQRRVRGLTVDQIKAGLDDLLDRCLRAPHTAEG
jgi:AcrR family transcriptional regulator